MTSCIVKASLLPSTVLILYFRYSFLAGFPSTKTTIAETGLAPEIFELSNASITCKESSFNNSAKCFIAPVVFLNSNSRRFNNSSILFFAFS
jgi:hypothetical protein